MEANRVEKFISWFSDLISKHKAVLLDGGFASLLEQMGHDLTSVQIYFFAFLPIFMLS